MEVVSIKSLGMTHMGETKSKALAMMSFRESHVCVQKSEKCMCTKVIAVRGDEISTSLHTHMT